MIVRISSQILGFLSTRGLYARPPVPQFRGESMCGSSLSLEVPLSIVAIPFFLYSAVCLESRRRVIKPFVPAIPFHFCPRFEASAAEIKFTRLDEPCHLAGDDSWKGSISFVDHCSAGRARFELQLPLSRGDSRYSRESRNRGTTRTRFLGQAASSVLLRTSSPFCRSILGRAVPLQEIIRDTVSSVPTQRGTDNSSRDPLDGKLRGSH